eukprot:scaffold47_cov334-Pavlova_lutheri.AAC.25
MDLVQERTVVEAMVLRRVILRVVGRRQRGGLVAIDGVVPEEVLHFRRCVPRADALPCAINRLEHGHRSRPGQAPEPPVRRQLQVRHAHVLFVRLQDASVFSQRLQLRGGRSGFHLSENGQIETLGKGSPAQEAAQVRLGDAADGIDVRAAAVVLGEITTETFIHVGASQHQQKATLLSPRPGQKLSQQESQHHPQARLHVLQGRVLRGAPSLRSESRLLTFAGHLRDGQDGLDRPVDPRHGVPGSDLMCQPGRPVLGLFAAVLRRQRRILPSQDASEVSGDPAVGIPLHLLGHLLGHGIHDGGHGGGIRTATQGQQETSGPGPAQVIPQPASRTQGNLFFDGVYPRHDPSGRRMQRLLLFLHAQGKIHGHEPGRPEFHRLHGRLFAQASHGSAVSQHSVQVHHRMDHLYLLHVELLSLGDQFTVHDHARATVVVQPTSIASPLIGVQVHPAPGLGGGAYELQPAIQLPQTMVAAASVGDEIHPRQGQVSVRGSWREELLAGLGSQCGIV